MHTFKHAVSWFEIPADDLQRAKKFYEAIFETTLNEMTLANNLKMALFPTEDGTVGGALCEHHEFYHPGHQGPLVYLNGNPDLQAVLDRVTKQGGKVLIPKRQISPDRGYMAVIEDSEGNRIALHSVS
ncbi:MAG: VOC family protein [Bacteroidota bacterium]